jgi:hypothetical protein
MVVFSNSETTMQEKAVPPTNVERKTWGSVTKPQVQSLADIMKDEIDMKSKKIIDQQPQEVNHHLPQITATRRRLLVNSKILEQKPVLPSHSISTETDDNEGFVRVTKNRLVTPQPSYKQRNPQLLTTKRSDLLCSQSVDHDSACKFCHSLSEWTPKICKFQSRCNKSTRCNFWHSEIESQKDYIQRSFDVPSSYFAKHRDQFIRLYLS